MKRSEINAAIGSALKILEDNGLRLPPFAYWMPEQWKNSKDKLENIKKVMLGWDVTDFGSGDFASTGAVLFTIRNGHLADPGAGTPYAEKLIIVRHETEQALPMHFHRMKTEDIINRGGGVLAMQLYPSDKDGNLVSEGSFTLKMDGIVETLPAGTVLEIEKGCSVTLTPGLFHRFWAKKGCGDLVVGEVSSINDDNTDNIFLEQGERFTQVVEDVPMEYILCNEYGTL